MDIAEIVFCGSPVCRNSFCRGTLMGWKRLDKKKQGLLIWTGICIFIIVAGMLLPVKETRTQGIGGANQANLKSKTEELTEGRILEFVLEHPQETAEEIGFFFTSNGHDYGEETVRITAMTGETVIGECTYQLKEISDNRFLFVPLPFETLETAPEKISVKICSDAALEGPSVWFNEAEVTPGSAYLDGESLPKSMIYNLVYTVWVHQYRGPLFLGLILILAGVGVYGVGGFVRSGKETGGRKERQPVFVMPAGRETAVLLLAVLAVASAFFYLYDTRIRIAQNTTEKITVFEADGETLPVNEKNSSFCQNVKPGEDRLTGFGVRFYVEEGSAPVAGSMYASVTDLTLQSVLCETEIDASQIVSGEYAGLLFQDSQTGVAGHEYQIQLVFDPELWDSGLAVMTSKEGLCVSAYLYFHIFLKRFFFFLFLCVEAFVCLFWYLTFVKRACMENILFITLLFCGLVYNVMLTPQMVPDEAKHMDMAYRYSNELLGYESLGDVKCLMRAEDAETEFTSSPSLKNYRNIYYGLFAPVQDSAMVEAEVNSNIEGSFLLYAPAVLGMSVARILGWGTVPMLLFARYLNLFVFALLARAGMKRLPFGKMTLFVMALLPVNVQQCTSFSHDAMVHGILFFYCCLCLQAIYEEKKMTGQRMLVLELCAWFLVYCKNGSYLPLCLLPLLIPSARYEGKRQKYLATGALVGIPILAFLMKHMQMVTGIVSTTEATSVVSTGGGAEYLTGYTLGYFLREPLELIYMLVNTILDKGGFYLESLVGYKLGWVEIETSMIVVFLFWFLLFLSVCDNQTEYVRIRKFQRCWMILLCAGSAGLILLGMLFQWTPVGHVSIEGVQGRYFLPFLLIFLTGCRNRGIFLKHQIDRGIATAAAAGQLLTLIYVIRQVTMV